MKSILSELYEGNIFPSEQFSAKSEECHKLYQDNYRRYESFIETLSKLDPPLDKQFSKIMDEQFDIVPCELSEIFVYGFRLGARIMMDIFQNDLFSGDVPPGRAER